MRRYLVWLITCGLGLMSAFADLPEIFATPIEKGGYGAHMLGDGVCRFSKRFFLFDIASFRSRQFNHGNIALTEIVLEYERGLDKRGPDEETVPLSDMNIAISTLKELETFLVERFKGRPFERREVPGEFTSFCEDVDGCGWCAELSVRTDVKRDKFVAKALFRRQTLQSNARANISVEGELLDDMYVIVTSPSLNSLVSRLGVKSRMMDLRSLTEETHLNLPTGCVLVIMPPPESGKKVAEGIFNKHAINHVAFVSPGDNENMGLSELKTLIVRIAKDLEKRRLEEKRIEALSLDERTARFHAQLASDLFGPYIVDKLTLPEVVQFLLFRINGEMRWHSEFSLGGMCRIGIGQPATRYSFKIPRMHAEEIFSFAAAHMHSTTFTNENGCIVFEQKDAPSSIEGK